MDIILLVLVNGLMIGGIYSLMTVGLTIIFGVMKVVNFAHGELLMVGMYVTYWLFTLLGVDPFVSLILCMGVLFCFGAVMQRVLITPLKEEDREMGSLLVTLGFGIFLQSLALFLCKADFRSVVTSYGTEVIEIGFIMIPLPRLIAFLIALGLSIILFLLLKKTYVGKAIRATSEDRETAMLMGINVQHVDLLAFGIGAACVGAAAAIITPSYFVFPSVGTMFGLTCFVAVVLGGLGSFIGAFIAGLIVGLAESFGVMYVSTQAKYLVTFVLFITVLIIKPAGLFGRKM
jgi:branched-chain amino acid transport system permease protein